MMIERPTLNFSKLSKGSKEELLNELYKLSTACEECGIFQVNVNNILSYYYFIII
jgi:isopenicillin N synthase-like dioxygenase